MGLDATKATLLRDEKWRWKEAWNVLKQNMKETRRAAKEGVEAIRLEANLYAAAVGKPGLVALQYAANHLTPKFFAKTLRESLQDALQTIHDDNVQNVELLDFEVGDKPPELLDARAYELGDDAMAFDLDIKWKSEMEATMAVKGKRIAMTVPITVRNANFEGVVRIVLSPLTPDPPGFGAALISLPTAPTIGIDVRMAGGEITRMPWLRSEIISTLQKSMEDQFLWPRRLVIPSAKPQQRHTEIETMLSKQELRALEYSDPLLRAEQKLARDLDSLHHQTPPQEHDRINERLEDLVDIQLKDADCLSALEGAEEELCIIDWDSFEVAANEKEENQRQAA